MNTIVTLKGITFDLQMNEKPFYLAGRGWFHHAVLIGSYPRDQMSDLIGETLWGSPIKAIESHAIPVLNNRPIGICLESKRWDGNE